MKVNDYVEVIGNLGCYTFLIDFLKHYNIPSNHFVIGNYIPVHDIYKIIFIGNNPLVVYPISLYVLESTTNQIYIMDNNHKEIILHIDSTRDNKQDDKWWLKYFYNVESV